LDNVNGLLGEQNQSPTDDKLQGVFSVDACQDKDLSALQPEVVSIIEVTTSQAEGTKEKVKENKGMF
jgi:hypothetical protein